VRAEIRRRTWKALDLMKAGKYADSENQLQGAIPIGTADERAIIEKRLPCWLRRGST